ncbi:MAG TPA: hypothetical protein VNT51_02670 [Miltoncostaeaceae bacterium]|nr:hypothetical protein [Miltoncostaeaceae bacterium]
MRTVERVARRARPQARWTAGELAEVVEAVLRGAPDRVWSADDVRARLAFGHEGAGPAATSVRVALATLADAGRVERVDVWGRRGWGNTVHAFRARPGAEVAPLLRAA